MSGSVLSRSLGLGVVGLVVILMILGNAFGFATIPWRVRREQFDLEVQAKPGQRGRATVAAFAQTILGGVAFLVLGIYFALGPGLSHPDAQANCNGVPMSPGEVCHFSRLGDRLDRNAPDASAGDLTYARMQDKATRGSPLVFIIGLTMAVAGLSCLLGSTVTIVGRWQDRRRGMPRPENHDLGGGTGVDQRYRP